MKARSKELSRRSFLIQGSAAGLLAARSGLAAPGAQERKVLHIIGHSHIDAAWLWPWRDSADTVLNTFRSALNRMKENTKFCFSHSSSMHYRWVQGADPKMFAEVRQRIQEGRWEVVGAWPVEPDCNIPATESFIRHCLYGKRYCKDVLATDVRIGFNPDSFGHAAGLPAILKGAGYDAYVFMRPQEHEMDLPLLFWWESQDGSRVLTLRIWKEYDGKAKAIPDAVQHDFAPGMNHAAFLLGVGDHGGAVTAEQVQEIVQMQNRGDLPELRFSTLQQFFTAVRESPGFANLPVIKTELQHHSRGCYSAYGEGKFLNRRTERALVESETIAVVANMAAGRVYPGAEYAASWWNLLFCQFHDLLAGTALYADYMNLRDSLGYACQVALASQVEALERMAKQVDTSSVKESAVFLFNPLPWRRAALLELHTEKDPDGHGVITHLVAKDGTDVPIQFRPPDSMTNGMPRLTAWIDLPACGYKVFELAHGPAPEAKTYSNAFTVSETGFGISSVKSEDGLELLGGPIGLVVLSDTSDTWSHDVKQFRQEMGRPTLVSAAVVENGPVTRVTRHRATWMSSEIFVDIFEYAGMNFLDLHFVIDWREHQQMVKLEIPTALARPRLFAKVPGEVLERHVNGQEEPYQDWAAVQGTIGKSEYTLGVLNNSTYSYDCLESVFRTVLIRSAPFARHQPSPTTYFDTNAWQDQGRQERRFRLIAGKGGYASLSLDRHAEEFQTPAEYVLDAAHAGEEPWEKSFLEVQPASVWVLVVKAAEDGTGRIIVRVQERAGVATTAQVTSPALGLHHVLALKPWQLKTLSLRRSANGTMDVEDVSFLEAVV